MSLPSQLLPLFSDALSLLAPPGPPPPPSLCPSRCPLSSGAGSPPSPWTVGRSVGVSLVPPPLAAGWFWAKACKPLTPAHICAHVHTRRDESTGAHARHHRIWGDNGFRAPAPPAGPGGPRQTTGLPTPAGPRHPPTAGPSKSSGWVCTSTGAVTDQEQGGGGGSGEGEAAPVPSPAPHPTLPRDQPGPPRPSRGPSGALLGQELCTKRQLPVGRAGGGSLCEPGPLLVTSLRAREGPFLPKGSGCWESAWGQSCRPAGGLMT